MITSNLLGPGDVGGGFNSGLGNILFQIATILSLAKDNNSTASFPRLKEENYSSFNKNILKKVKTDIVDFQRVYREPSLNYSEVPFFENTMYYGYFQSEKYFIHNRDLIINTFKPQDIINQIISNFPFLIEPGITSLHVRRGDYVKLSNIYNLLTIEYFTKSVEILNSDKIIIFSDDINWCKLNLPFKNVIYMENNPEYIDLLAMSLCENNIISNSTFSWWGAWLNNNTNKKVITPKRWFSSQFNHEINPDSWIKI